MSGDAADGAFRSYKPMNNTCLIRRMMEGETNMEENRTVGLEPEQMEKATGGDSGVDGLACPGCGQPLKPTATGAWRCFTPNCPVFTNNQEINL